MYVVHGTMTAEAAARKLVEEWWRQIDAISLASLTPEAMESLIARLVPMFEKAALEEEWWKLKNQEYERSNYWQKRAEAAEAELERWRHGATIEGDFVCPNGLALANVEAECQRLQEQTQALAVDGANQRARVARLEEAARALLDEYYCTAPLAVTREATPYLNALRAALEEKT